MTEGGRTALVVVTREAERDLIAWRRRYLRDTVERGIPAHVTILFPFVPADRVDDTFPALRELYAPLVPFTCELASVESFPGYAWLAPRPAERFLDLIGITRRAFPDYPPYGELELEPIPHCTVGAEEDPARLDEIVAELRDTLGAELPLRCRVGAVTLLEELPDATWVERHAFPLAGHA